MGKINDFENDALKAERVEMIFEIWILLRDTENAKNDANTSRTYFLGFFCCFFCNFWFFSNCFPKWDQIG